MKKELLINCEIVASKIVKFLRREFRSRGKTTAILGLSGGIDSATVAFLCKKAGLDLRVVMLPYGYNPKGNDIVNAKKVIKSLNLKKSQIFLVDIKPLVNSQVEKFKNLGKLDLVDKGNIMARQRMVVQYFLARCFNGLVVGTENLSEYYLGYFTRHGDQAADINPIHGLLKTQVYQLAKYLGLPQEIIKITPTAGLWKGQTDEKDLGFTYGEADAVLYYGLIKKHSSRYLIKEKGFSEFLIEKVLKRIKDSQFKRDPIPSYKYYKN